MNLQELASKYYTSKSEKIRTAIIKESIPLVKSIVGKVQKPKNFLSENEDLISIGFSGLLQALESYVPNNDAQFKTFAYYRIRGSIIDYLRSIDELPRAKRSDNARAQVTIERLQQKLGRIPYDFEVAQEMGMPIKKYKALLLSVQQRTALSLDYSEVSGSSFTMKNNIQDTSNLAPDEEMEQTEERAILKNEIEKLTEREQLILGLYYYEELTLREISAKISISEARISQIIGKVLLVLRGKVRAKVLA
tara:strand:+ start:2755 stop:3504 length:750 start_codon:yes stop_codon:yes gene_type:complete